MSLGLVSYGDSSDSDSEKEGTTLKLNGPERSQDIRKLLSVLPAPVKGGKQRVRVGVPSLKQQNTAKGVSLNTQSYGNGTQHIM